MQFGFLNEDQLREASNGVLDELMDKWHRSVSEKTDNRIDIRLGNRRDNHSPIRGGILTESVITQDAGKTVLIVWYDPLEIYYDERIAEEGYSGIVIDEITQMLKDDRGPGPACDPVSNPDKIDWDKAARQIGRWVLRFRGFRRLANENSKFRELETFLNLEGCIPALYSLFSEAGYDYQTGEEKRLREVYEGLKTMEEPPKRLDRALNALRISNILEYNTDSSEKKRLEGLLLSKFEATLKAKEQIDDIKKEFVSVDPVGFNSFMIKLVSHFRMPGSWVTVDETKGFFH